MRSGSASFCDGRTVFLLAHPFLFPFFQGRRFVGIGFRGKNLLFYRLFPVDAAFFPPRPFGATGIFSSNRSSHVADASFSENPPGGAVSINFCRSFGFPFTSSRFPFFHLGQLFLFPYDYSPFPFKSERPLFLPLRFLKVRQVSYGIERDPRCQGFSFFFGTLETILLIHPLFPSPSARPRQPFLPATD